jgi:predicted nucleic acid-binding protein
VSFVDTNVLVYATAVGAPFRVQARAALARLAIGGTLSVSRQVLREYIAVMTRQQNWGKPLA